MTLKKIKMREEITFDTVINWYALYITNKNQIKKNKFVHFFNC